MIWLVHIQNYDWELSMHLAERKNDTRWIYKCKLGEFEVWASSKSEVITVLVQHGFLKHKIIESNIVESPSNAEHEEIR